ncbi:MAG TPA: hypothetical protein VM008_12015 [Phycisphaerae bacterium]|nr:hypothetical protein [Phycisphaerae bacterium]
MKSFPSIAARLRSIARMLHAAGWALCILSLVRLAWISVSDLSRNNAVSAMPVNTSSTTRPMEQGDVLAVLASRSLRMDLKPPAPPAAPTPVAQTVHPPDIEVIGTIVNPGQPPSAFVRSKRAGKLVTVKPGSEVDGATVKSITEGQLILELQGQEFPVQVGRKGS